MEPAAEVDVLWEDAGAVDVDEGASVVTMTCVVGMTDGAVYTVDVALDLDGGGRGGGMGGSSLLRMAENDGGTISTVAHCVVNQSDVV